MKRACCVLMVSLCVWSPLAQTVHAQSPVVSVPMSVPGVAPISIPIGFEAARTESIWKVPASFSARTPEAGAPRARQADPGSSSRFSKPLLITGIALAGGGIAMTFLSYSEESYQYSYCPGCNPPQTTTLYRDTTSAGMYWGGVSAAAAGAGLVVWSFFKK